ncbi:RNA-binding protein NOB1 [Dermatophagoides pteronyssinus]|uniref:RNA-binding protein NOB1 n=1 Tax=Dermatophagoides pteronyssinus TaxID=6956 RepID=UPI003F676062
MMIQKKVQHLVADSGAFIFNCPLQDYGETIYTLNDVVNEIKDEKTRESLQILPYELKYREPTDEDIKFVAYFAKKTGDFNQLSKTDIRLIALTVRLEKEINKGINLKENPDIKILPTKSSNSNSLTVKDLELFGYDVKNGAIIDSIDKNETQEINEIKSENEPETDGPPVDDNDDDDDNGWITEENFQEIRDKLMGIKFDEDEDDDDELTVACITGDFAMQNVLMQMGLNVVSPKDGLHIRQTRQYIMRCHACCRINPSTATKFCKYCGNCQTLKRVAITINKDGTVKMHINFKRPIRIRGKKYSLPMPRGGKHANNPILCEDQRIPQQRKSKTAVEEKKLLNMQTILTDPDYLVRSNPFAINDVYSRASRMIPKQRKQINPNETKKPTGNRKKSNKNF